MCLERVSGSLRVFCSSVQEQLIKADHRAAPQTCSWWKNHLSRHKLDSVCTGVRFFKAEPTFCSWKLQRKTKPCLGPEKPQKPLQLVVVYLYLYTKDEMSTDNTLLHSLQQQFSFGWCCNWSIHVLHQPEEKNTHSPYKHRLYMTGL